MAKEILLSTRNDCGCYAKTHRGVRELMEGSPVYETLHIREIEETRESEFIEKLSYYAVSTPYLGGMERFEAHIGIGYGEIKTAVKHVFDEALG